MQAVQRCNACCYLGFLAGFGGQHLRLGPVAGLCGLDLRLGSAVGACGWDLWSGPVVGTCGSGRGAGGGQRASGLHEQQQRHSCSVDFVGVFMHALCVVSDLLL